MGFTSDQDLEKYQPYLFTLNSASFEDFHDDAAADITDALSTLWLPYQSLIEESSFSEEILEADQWVMASVYRVLGWYVLPRLSAEIGGEGLLSMMQHYRTAYPAELQRQIKSGVRCLLNGMFTAIAVTGAAERSRRQR